MNDFTAEDHIWMNIICSQISPCTQLTTLIDMHACILDIICFNAGHLVISDLKFYRNHDGIHLLFPSLTIRLCGKFRVVEFPDDTWV